MRTIGLANVSPETRLLATRVVALDPASSGLDGMAALAHDIRRQLGRLWTAGSGFNCANSPRESLANIGERRLLSTLHCRVETQARRYAVT